MLQDITIWVNKTLFIDWFRRLSTFRVVVVVVEVVKIDEYTKETETKQTGSCYPGMST